MGDGTSEPASVVRGEVDLVWAPLTVAPLLCQRLWELLSPEERHRADAVQHPSERDRRAVGRAWLRILLGQRLGTPARAVDIVQEGAAKPVLRSRNLQFSASRRGDRALFALSEVVAVGIHLELIDPSRDLAAVGDRFFTARERAALAQLPPSKRLTAAYQCWTRKEAVLKGIGVGLGVEPATVEVWAPGDAPVRVAGWRVEAVDLDRRYAAALAGEESRPWTATAPRELQWSPK